MYAYEGGRNKNFLVSKKVDCFCCGKEKVEVFVEPDMKRMPRKICLKCYRRGGNVDNWAFDGNKRAYIP